MARYGCRVIMRGPAYRMTWRMSSRSEGRKQWTLHRAQAGLPAPNRQSSIRWWEYSSRAAQRPHRAEPPSSDGSISEEWWPAQYMAIMTAMV
jgi:hypothetical protein